MKRQTVERLNNLTPQIWVNPNYKPFSEAMQGLEISNDDVMNAQKNWEILSSLLAKSFGELQASNGVIESQLIPIPELQEALGIKRDWGTCYIKGDHALPVAGSIKARGGIYEVFMYAWHLAIQENLIGPNDDPVALANLDIRKRFEKTTIAVGSTGNLGLSVGMAARALGFQAVVHMSSDAKAWKVERLKKFGVEVIQHEADYGTAVRTARLQAEDDDSIYFVDDECSELLFFGYSVAALHLKSQLEQNDIVVDHENPLFIYLPCGIGGAPGGVAFGAKQVFGDNVHCFFVEPVQSPCALVQLMEGPERIVNVYDYGLTNKTEADGMAVAEVSQFVSGVMYNLLSGVFTVSDDDLLRWLYLANSLEGLKLEPSATASFAGPDFIMNSEEGKQYMMSAGLTKNMHCATHILWATGGNLVPNEQYEQLLARGSKLV